MARSITVAQKGRIGRPATGITPLMAFRPPLPLRAAIEAYAKSNEVSVSEALRRLVELGLAKGKGGKR